MHELCVTFEEIENWFTEAAASSEIISLFTLTKDKKFVLEHRPAPENPGTLTAFVCYAGYCEVTNTAKEAVDVVEENLNKAFQKRRRLPGRLSPALCS